MLFMYKFHIKLLMPTGVQVLSWPGKSKLAYEKNTYLYNNYNYHRIGALVWCLKTQVILVPYSEQHSQKQFLS